MRTKLITYEILKKDFMMMFSEPRVIGEVFYEKYDNKYVLEFVKGGFIIRCEVSIRNILDDVEEKLLLSGKQLDEETVQGALLQFENTFLRFAIPAKNFGFEEKKKEKNNDEIVQASEEDLEQVEEQVREGEEVSQ